MLENELEKGVGHGHGGDPGHDVDDGLGRHAGDGGAADMLYIEQLGGETVPQAAAFGLEACRPGGVVLCQEHRFVNGLLQRLGFVHWLSSAHLTASSA